MAAFLAIGFVVPPAGAEDTSVTTIVGTSGARVLAVPATAALTADLNTGNSNVALSATTVTVSETAALGADWGVTVELCGADASGGTNADTDPITATNVVKDCGETRLERADQTTNIVAANNSVDETDGVITKVGIDGVLNPAPTVNSNEGALSATIEVMDSAGSEVSTTAYTALYTWAGDYKVDATGAQTGTYYGYLQYTLNQ